VREVDYTGKVYVYILFKKGKKELQQQRLERIGRDENGSGSGNRSGNGSSTGSVHGAFV
jgi:hypothetical protein